MQRTAMGFPVRPSEARGTTAVFARRVSDSETTFYRDSTSFCKLQFECRLLCTIDRSAVLASPGHVLPWQKYAWFCRSEGGHLSKK